MTQQDGFMWAKNEHTEKQGQEKPLIRWGKMYSSPGKKKKKKKGDTDDLYYLCQPHTKKITK